MWKLTALRRRVSVLQPQLQWHCRGYTALVFQTLLSVAAWVLVSPGLDQSAVDLIFSSSPSLKYFGDRFPHPFRGQLDQKLLKNHNTTVFHAQPETPQELPNFEFLETNLKYL